MTDFRYRAFISYSHADEHWAAWLHRSLESYRVPRRLAGREGPAGGMPARLSPVFRDREELSTSRDLSSNILEALGQSEALVVICSPSAAQSRWVNEEIRHFQSLGRGHRIFCVIVDGDPAGRDSDEACFPAALFEEAEAEDREPLAADVRPWADGKRLARLKLISGLLGTRLDDLRQRDLQRRRRWAVVSALGAIAALALAIIALVSWANEQKEREKAEQLVTFIVDLGERLQSDTDLDTLASISEAATAYFQELDLEKLSPDSGREVALVFRQVGRVSELQGRPGEALEAYRKSKDLIAGLLEEHPNNRGLMLERGNAEFYIGSFYLDQVNYEFARQAFENYHTSALALLEADPESPEGLLEVSYSLTGLMGVQLESAGVDGATLQYAAEAIALISRAMELAPGDSVVESHYANTLAWAADVNRDSCNLESARSFRLQTMQLAEAAYRGDPSNNDLKRRLAYAISGVGVIQELLGELEASAANLEEARRLLAELAAADPSNVLYRNEVLDRQFMLAELAGETGRLADARTAMQDQEDAMDERGRPDPEGGLPSDIYVQFLLAFADVSFRSGDVAKAEELLDRAIRLLSPGEGLTAEDWITNHRLIEARYLWWAFFGEDRARDAPVVSTPGSDTPREFRSCLDTDLKARMLILSGDFEGALTEAAYLRSRSYAEPSFMRFCGVAGLCPE